MVKKIVFCFSVLLFILGPLTKETLGQTLDKEHAVYIDIDAGITPIENSFTNEFTPSPAVNFNIRFPYLSGQMEGGLRYLHFDGHAHSKVNSDFKSFYLYGGYYYPFRITDWYELGPVLRIGYKLLYYQEPRIYTDQTFHYKTEMAEGEFAYELVLRNQFQISNHWFFEVSMSYNHTYTKIPLPLTMLSFGFSYAFNEPEWIKTIIK